MANWNRHRSRPLVAFFPKNHIILLMLCSVALLGSFLTAPSPELKRARSIITPFNLPNLDHEFNAYRVNAELASVPPESVWETIVIQSGDNLSHIFSTLGLPSQDLHAILDSSPAAKKLAELYPGSAIEVKISPENHLEGLKYQASATETLMVKSQNGIFSTELETKPVDIQSKTASVTIKDSLFLSGQGAGLSDQLVMELAKILGYDIDFALDIRDGDHFSVLYEEHFVDNEKIKQGNILAAVFYNQGHKYTAVRYEDQEGNVGYYTAEGLSMQKAFLRTPVEFSRISSYFNAARKHPILHKIRAHKGVDYAAPGGTPIHATAKGKILLAGRKGGYGNTVILQHGKEYRTLYAHMSRFAKGVRTGASIKQGQIIGYVGSTGLATGPHLHYEFHVNGIHKDPLKIKLPKALALGSQELNHFKAKAQELLTQLEGSTTVALGHKTTDTASN